MNDIEICWYAACIDGQLKILDRQEGSWKVQEVQRLRNNGLWPLLQFI